MLLFAVVSMAQNKITVSGVVTDKTGETVIGASVRVKGQENMGTITDIDGKYQIPGVPANATLIFSYIGMKEQEVALNGRSTVNLMMEEDSQLIEEVVVVGYGSAKKRDLTGSIVTVKAAEIASKPSTNPLASIQGKVAKVKLAFSAVLCAVLCFLFPVASPLFFSLFLGVAVRESGMKHIYDFVSGPLLYGSTFMLGVLLGVLCDAHLLLDPKILKLLVLGIVALLLSGIGGIIGGYIMYIVKRGNYNPVVGIAAVSCVPTTAKVAQKIVSKDNPDSFVLGDALGANISGVITSAIITGIYITIIPYL